MRQPRMWGERRGWTIDRRPGAKPGRSRRRLLPQGRPGPAGGSPRMFLDEPATGRGGDGSDDQQPGPGDREEPGIRLSEINSDQADHREEEDPLELACSAVQQKLMFFAASNEFPIRRGRGVGACRIVVGDHGKSMPRVWAADKRTSAGSAYGRTLIVRDRSVNFS